MRIACVTTTINVPRVLALYGKYGVDARFFVVIDKKTSEEAVNFCVHDLPNTKVVFIHEQEKWKCSEFVGWNCIQRRNIGFLEALKWGADVVVSIDDDNIPLDNQYFFDFKRFTYYTELSDYRGLLATSPSGWFDVGELLQPRAPHRGFPHDKRAQPAFEPIVGAKIGVCAGICLGDPDIGAVERIANAPMVHSVSELLRAGVVVDPKQTWTVFNSQNTAVVRDLVPAWFMFPGVGRYDDIFASLVVQRVMRQTGHFVHFGKPFVFQQRNQHDLIKDLRDEIDGMKNIIQISEVLNDAVLPLGTVVDLVRVCYREAGLFSRAAEAWCDDCESVLK